MANLIVFMFFFCSLLLVVVVSGNAYPFFSKIQMPPGVTGPESAAFDAAGGGPYVSVTDGRVLKWDSTLKVFVEFAYTAPNRLLKYDPVTKQVTVLLRGLAGAGGPAVSFDRSFVLVSEYVGKRIQKFWLTGVKANTAEILINLPGNPNKIKRSETEGEYWVALNVISQQPILFTAPQGLRINGLGMLLETLPLVTGYFNASIAVVQEHNLALYIGSRDTDFVGVLKKVP
ncbi:hypothetical protein RHGRI_018652 [Rhododendron griersonianum]|uniref:Strictosidine synthase conserved region domain-containing protein n=1 Tax=Rhododendron griersonianum TaxID=479676 RepID=A0AAV6K2D2_9ERIC|nr:hypothetical protein RHGRI_018652 [Rhododendron griersonianum]